MASQKDARQAASTESAPTAGRPDSAPVASSADSTAGALDGLTGDSDSPAASPARFLHSPLHVLLVPEPFYTGPS